MTQLGQEPESPGGPDPSSSSPVASAGGAAMPLSEPELNAIEAALPPADGADGDVPKARLPAKEALERLHVGETLENVRIERLAFKGEFPLPVRLKRCVLVQPHFDGAKFHGEV